MKVRFPLICICFLTPLFFVGLYGQSNQNTHSKTTIELEEGPWMIPPIKHKLGLSGTFGELRRNHFHTGVDIKSSNGTVGDPIYAVADGYISRIRVTKASYGNALYIDHPNGKTTVYAHLNNYRDDIAEYVENLQYKLESFEIDTLFAEPVFYVKQGDLIGQMGNSGSSFGAHLHFEVRDTKTEIAINPLKEGLKVVDKSKPLVEFIRLHGMNDQLREINSKNFTLRKNNSGNYYYPSGVITYPAWRVGVSVFVNDLMTGVSNRNGIYGLQLFVDNKEVFGFSLDSISFDNMNYCNAHIDYSYYTDSKRMVHSCYRKEGNLIPLYQEKESPIIKLFQDSARQIKIVVFDYNQNQSIVEFQIKRDPNIPETKPKVFNYQIPFNEISIIDQEDMKIKFDSHSIYEDLLLYIDRTKEDEPNFQSDVFHIAQKNTPVQKPFDLYIKPRNMDSTLLSKTILASCEGTKYKSFGGHVLADMVGAKVNRFGSLALIIDTIPPAVQVISFPYAVQSGSRICFKIDDNIISVGDAEELRYKATVDNQWLLFEYDLKYKTISYYVDDRIPKGEHEFILEVSDDRNNKKVYRRKFTRK